MLIESWIVSFTEYLAKNVWFIPLRAVFYALIIGALFWKYGQGNLTMANFIYQGF
jgi:hypothetical protein